MTKFAQTVQTSERWLVHVLITRPFNKCFPEKHGHENASSDSDWNYSRLWRRPGAISRSASLFWGSVIAVNLLCYLVDLWPVLKVLEHWQLPSLLCCLIIFSSRKLFLPISSSVFSLWSCPSSPWKAALSLLLRKLSRDFTIKSHPFGLLQPTTVTGESFSVHHKSSD